MYLFSQAKQAKIGTFLILILILYINIYILYILSKKIMILTKQGTSNDTQA